MSFEPLRSASWRAPSSLPYPSRRPLGRALRAGVMLAGAACVLASAASAAAFSLESQVSAGCHEGIASDALRAVRQDLRTAAPLPSTGDDGALINDVPFSIGDDMTDLGGATLLIGIRDNDLKGRDAESIDQLTEVHGDPSNQREHCLRGPDQDETTGTNQSLLDCRQFIRERATAALEGLDDQGFPDPNRRTSVDVYLSFAGKSQANLPTYYLEIGRAMHAVQDSFAHSFRSADGTHVTVALNWIDYAEGTLVESRDGPEHRGPMDHCDDPDDLLRQRHRLAVDASAALLRATLDPSLDHAGKLAAVDAVLDRYLAYQPGCTFDNHWCNAPEQNYTNASACGCTVAGRQTTGAALALVALSTLAALVARRGGKSHVA